VFVDASPSTVASNKAENDVVGMPGAIIINVKSG
jgi:hypothetical protein